MSLRIIGPDGAVHMVAFQGPRTAADYAALAGWPLETPCGGHRVCGRCRVTLHAGRFRLDGTEIDLPEGVTRTAPGCGTLVLDESSVFEIPAGGAARKGLIDSEFASPDYRFAPSMRRMTVRVPTPGTGGATSDADRLLHALASEAAPALPVPSSALLSRLPSWLGGEDSVEITAILSRDESGWSIFDLVRATDATPPLLGLAIDIGTTTVVGAAVDLTSGRLLARDSAYNGQIQCAEDVASRIAYAENETRVRELQHRVVEDTINPILRALCESIPCRPEDFVRVAVAGNTVMTHLFAGLSPAGMGGIPFHPITHRHPTYRAADLGLRVHPRACVEAVPSISSYVGGDLTADLMAARMLGRDAPTMLVDIGTNGEIVLWTGRKLMACATAAGPAFEGAGLRHGCRATDGAIDHLRLSSDGGVSMTTIGSAPPRGLCGSGIIDFMAEARRAGFLSETGRYDLDRVRAAGRYFEEAGPSRGIHSFMLSEALSGPQVQPLTVSERDVAEILKAKAAIAAGMQTLMDRAGLAWSDLRGLILAGGFARYLDARQAIRIGLLPDLPADRIEILGNGSLAGACLTLVDGDAAAYAARIREAAEVIELNLEPSFEGHYIESLLLP